MSDIIRTTEVFNNFQELVARAKVLQSEGLLVMPLVRSVDRSSDVFDCIGFSVFKEKPLKVHKEEIRSLELNGPWPQNLYPFDLLK